MRPTSHPHVNAILATLLSEMQRILGDKLVGLYLYGSLVVGDFENESSDIDLLAATSVDIEDRDFDALKQMHDDFARHHQEWEGRIEVQYLSVAALRIFKAQTHKMAVISPGEPFHVIEAGKHYTPNWYVVQEQGATLFGPSPRTLIDPISKEEFVDAIREHARQWRQWVQDTGKGAGSQAYAILTMCRALYTCTYGEQVSKKRAALWARHYLPEWAPLIATALRWRATWREAHAGAEAAFPETLRFVHFVIDRIARDRI